eukprot:scaffold3491_cov160-Ochromonas_danica.AAC.5
MESLGDVKLFLVARPGPTVFVLKDEHDQTARVTLGNPHKCTCGSSTTTCIHQVYCVIKVLKVPKDHPLSFQSSLTDMELDIVLSGSLIRSSNQRSRPIRGLPVTSPNEDVVNNNNSPKSKTDCGNAVPRQELLPDEENPCTICQDEMKSDQPLTWCRHGCGNNFHAACMMKFARHKESNRQDPTCPLCRVLWDMALLKLDCRVKSNSGDHPCVALYCQSCKCKLRRLFNRCLECSQKTYTTAHKHVDFCHDCFDRLGESHRGHHFLTSDASVNVSSEVSWHPARNPLDRQARSRPLPPALLALQHRDISVDDYTLLMQLEEKPEEESISSVLLAVMPEISKDTICNGLVKYERCWCGEEHSALMLSLPCGHLAHRMCLNEEVSVLATQDVSSLASYRCPHSGCGKVVFGILRRRQPPRKAAEKPHEKVQEKMSEFGQVRMMVGALPQINGHGLGLSTVPTFPLLPELSSSQLQQQQQQQQQMVRRRTVSLPTPSSSSSSTSIPSSLPGLLIIDAAGQTLNREPRRIQNNKLPPRGIGALRSISNTSQPLPEGIVALQAASLLSAGIPDSLSQEIVQSRQSGALSTTKITTESRPVRRLAELRVVPTFSRSSSAANPSLLGDAAWTIDVDTPHANSARRPSLRTGSTTRRRTNRDGRDDGGEALTALISVTHYL